MHIIYLFISLTNQDALLEKYSYKGSFSDLQKKDIGRPKKSLFVRQHSNNLNKVNVPSIFSSVVSLCSTRRLSFVGYVSLSMASSNSFNGLLSYPHWKALHF